MLQAILISRGAPQPYLQCVLEYTRGIAFMGTPHAGSDLTKWGSILTSISTLLKATNREIVEVLKPGSEVLANLQQEFHLLIERRRKDHKPDLDLYCCFEELPVVNIGMVSDAHSSR